jgi:hypothetical protein
MSQEAKKSAKRPDRSKTVRQPLGQRNRLTFRGDMEEGYNYRVINDKDARLQDALDGGYEFVHSKEKLGDDSAAEGTAMDSRVAKPVGGGTTGYLMRIPNEFYEADQAAKEADIKKTEKGMQPKNQKEVEEAYGDGLQDK